MTKVVSLEDRRNQAKITYHYREGDCMRSVAWAIGSEGAAELEQAIIDAIANKDPESDERMRTLLWKCLAAYRHFGPEGG